MFNKPLSLGSGLDPDDAVLLEFAPQLHESAGGPPQFRNFHLHSLLPAREQELQWELKLLLHSSSLPWSKNATTSFEIWEAACTFEEVGSKQVQSEVIKVGLFDSNVFVRNALIALYSKCRKMSCARALFDEFNGKDLVSWNLMLCAFVECGDMVEARKMFDEMSQKDVVSWSIMIDGYGKVWHYV
ncbi:pentatricopeptide repeat-containing protein [Tanacetum coccineum]